MAWKMYDSSCGCLKSAPEPQIEDFEWRTSTDPERITYQGAHKKWSQTWEAQLRKHKEETKHNCIG